MFGQSNTNVPEKVRTENPESGHDQGSQTNGKNSVIEIRRGDHSKFLKRENLSLKFLANISSFLSIPFLYG